MPNRVLRDGAIHSRSVNSVSVLAEVLFYRLLIVADDFGLFEADPWTVKSKAFPARDVAPGEIEACLFELAEAGLVRAYEYAGRRFGAINRWEQRRYAKHPKYPEPPWSWEHIRGGYVDPRARANGAKPPEGGNPPQGADPPESTTEQQTSAAPRRQSRGRRPTSATPAEPDLPELPEWVPLDAWNGWLAMRRSKRAPNTGRALRMALEDLTKLRSQGEDPAAVLRQSELNRWLGLFHVKHRRIGASTPGGFRGPDGVAL